jgi:hypothetical protein
MATSNTMLHSTDQIYGAIMDAITIPDLHRREAEVGRLLDLLISRVQSDMRLAIAKALNSV